MKYIVAIVSTSILLAASLTASLSVFADEPQRKKAAETETAAQDVFIKIPDIPGESTRAPAPPPAPAMNKAEIISEVADEPTAQRKPAAPVRPAPVRPDPARTTTVRPIAPAAPAPQADTDNSNTKSGGINTIQSGCTLEEKLKGNKICKKDD